MRSNFFRQLEELNPNAENRTLTVLSGERRGLRFLYSGGKQLFPKAGEAASPVSAEEYAALPVRAALVTESGERIYTELLTQEKQLIICGGGHVSLPIIRMARMLDFRVTVLEDREEFAEHARAAGASKVRCGSYETLLEEIPGGADTFFVIVTRAHRFDLDCLRVILRKPCAYIGMMGSKRRVAMVMHTLSEEGVPRELLETVHSPIGLKIEAETPEEIAVSVIAEIVAVKNRNPQSFGYPAELLSELQREEREDCVLATIIARRGAAPRTTGTKMLIFKDRTVGTIGGGCAEGWVLATAQDMLSGSGETFCSERLDLKAMAEEEESMVCGGEIEVLLECL